MEGGAITYMRYPNACDPSAMGNFGEISPEEVPYRRLPYKLQDPFHPQVFPRGDFPRPSFLVITFFLRFGLLCTSVSTALRI
jgi:hypothetical protein